MEQQLIIRPLDLADYETTWTAMRAFTDARTAATPDELWLVDHPPVFTMGLKGRNGTTQEIKNIPLVYSDRGGDITYHGPGQIVLYAMIDIVRLGIGIKRLVQTLEQSALDYLASQGITAERLAGAPGVYVGGKKIASLGLRVRRASSYHGLALNVNMDLTPFTYIDPCGYRGMQVTQLAALGASIEPGQAGDALAQRFADLLGYNSPVILSPTHSAVRPLHG